MKAFNTLHSTRVECGVGGPGQFPHSKVQFQQVERVSKRAKPFVQLYNLASELLLQ